MASTLSRRGSMPTLLPSEVSTKPTFKGDVLGRRHSIGGEKAKLMKEFTDEERVTIKRSVGHFSKNHEGIAFHKWLEVLEQQRFEDLVVKARWIYQHKFSHLPSRSTCSQKDMDILHKWVEGMCSSVFYKASKKLVRHLVTNSIYKVFEENEPIFFQTNHGDYYYLVLSGKVSIFIAQNEHLAVETAAWFAHYDWSTWGGEDITQKLGEQVTTIEEGVGFGEVALMQKRPIRTASAVAEMMSEILMVPKSVYLADLVHLHKADDTLEKRMHFLKNECNLFSQWSEDRLVQLAYIMREESFCRGSIIERQGDPVEDLRLLMSGEVEISEKGNDGRRYLVALKGKGAFVGKLEVLDGEKQTVTVTAHTNVSLYHIPRVGYERIIAKTVLDGVSVKRSFHNLCKLSEESHRRRLNHITETRRKHPLLFRSLGPEPKVKIRPLGKLEGERKERVPPANNILTYEELVNATKRDSQGFPPLPFEAPTKDRLPWATGEDVSNWEERKATPRQPLTKDSKMVGDSLDSILTRGSSGKMKKKKTSWKTEPPDIIPRTLEFMETKFSMNNPLIKDALARR